MSELALRPELADRLRACAPPYHERALVFVLAALEDMQVRLPVRRHVSGAELAWACRDFAFAQFGLMAGTVLEHWGVRTTRDFGRIVYLLVDIGLLDTQAGDREDDFADIYSFAEAFSSAYVWQAQRTA